MPLTPWNLEGGFCFTEWWKVGWCEDRWIRWLAELHQSAYPLDCTNTLGADLRVSHLHESSPGRHSALSGCQFTNIGNCSRISSSWRLPTVWPSSRSSRPPPSSFQSIRKHTSYGFICTSKHFHKFCVFCSSCLPFPSLQKLSVHFISPRRRNCSYARPSADKQTELTFCVHLAPSIAYQATFTGIEILRSFQFVATCIAVDQRFSNFFQVGTIFISQNVLRTTLLLNVLSIC